VNEATLNQHGAVSEFTVREMASGALQRSRAHVSLAVSGIAGPSGGTADKPLGTVWFAWCVKDRMCVSHLHHLAGNRSEIRAQSVRIALQGVLDLLNQLTETV
jgi:nicotinamide-nucleotide amidase